MHYDSVLTYVRKIFENMHIPTTIFEEPFEEITLTDNGLRESLFKDFDVKEEFTNFKKACKENTLYYFTDYYYCSYVCMILPNPDKLQYFVIGPFTYVEINQKNYQKFLEKLDIPANLLPAMENYYYNIAYVSSETQFKNLISTLCDTIWQDSQYSVSVIYGNFWKMPYTKDYINVNFHDN